MSYQNPYQCRVCHQLLGHDLDCPNRPTAMSVTLPKTSRTWKESDAPAVREARGDGQRAGRS